MYVWCTYNHAHLIRIIFDGCLHEQVYLNFCVHYLYIQLGQKGNRPKYGSRSTGTNKIMTNHLYNFQHC